MNAGMKRVVWPALALSGVACPGRFEAGPDLRAEKVVLQREVEGIREVVGRLERGEPMLPPGDVAIAVDDTLVRDIIAAGLPFDADVDRYHVTLREAEVHFKGSPVVRLRGSLVLRDRPAFAAAVDVIGALVDVRVDQASSTLRARVAVDHLGIEEAGGIEQILSGSTLDEVAQRVRLQIEEQLPRVLIPVKVQQSIDLPAVTRGPVRIDGARMPLQVAVSRVVAGQGRLWVAVHFQPGDLVRTADAPEAGDASAAEAGVSLGADGDVDGGPPSGDRGRRQ